MPYMILKSAKVSTDLTIHQHALAQDYLSILLSIRDREQIIRVLCRSNPDHLTEGVRTLVSTYEPMIRRLHQAVDLSGTVADLEFFLKDMIKLSKIFESGSKGAKDWQPPTVGDFIQLLHKHQGASHRFIHQCGKNGPELMAWFHEWLTACAVEFRRKEKESKSDAAHDAGDLTSPLNDLFTALPEEEQNKIEPILTAHAQYLKTLHASSLSRLRAILASPRTNHPALTSPRKATSTAPSSRAGSVASSRAQSPEPSGNASSVSSAAAADAAAQAAPGPGAYLARWQSLIEATSITPATAEGPVRRGGSGSVLRASRTGGADAEANIDEDTKGGTEEQDQSGGEEEKAFEDAVEKLSIVETADGSKGEEAKRPDTTVVVIAMVSGFREMLGTRACVW
jgi:hypothetical protein